MKAAETATALISRIQATDATPFEIAKASFSLAEIVPELLAEIARLNKILLTARPSKKRIDVTCISCQTPFKVYRSQLKTGRACGKYCTIACYQNARKAACSSSSPSLQL